MRAPERSLNDLVATHGLAFLLREDYRSHFSDWTRPGFRALASYRVAVWAQGLQNPLLRTLFVLIGRMLLVRARNRYGIELSHKSIFGRRLCLGHQNGIVIHKYARIGDDCTIRQGVTLGMGGITRWQSEEQFKANAPILGDRVDIGAGAMIVGKVRIGDDVNIGPNAVVLTDVPAGATVMAPMSKMMQRLPSATRAVAAETGSIS